jgi:copper chaperone
MAIRSDTIQVTGIRCEQCVMRLGGALQGIDGLEAANANLVGQVMLTWDDERVRLEELVERMAKAGFRPVE